MSDTTPTPDGNAAPNDGQQPSQQAAPSMRVLVQYLKDLSFESPKAPASLMQASQSQPPQIEVNVDVNGRGVAADQFEVELSVSARAQRGSDVVFVVEATYAGVFEIKNVSQTQMELLMLVECPRLLFPFLRQIIAETTSSGNFPPVMLDPIDFFAIYQRRAEQGQPQAEPALT